jgi:hypothetical protein
MQAAEVHTADGVLLATAQSSRAVSMCTARDAPLVAFAPER